MKPGCVFFRPSLTKQSGNSENNFVLSPPRDQNTTGRDATRTGACSVLVIAILAIAIGYASAFKSGGAPEWAPWLLALGIPVALGSIMVLGAARGSSGIGALKIPILLVFVMLGSGFCLALALPPSEAGNSPLFLGLPLRAAIIVYGTGLLPTLILPIVYALTFETQTLSEADIARVRELGDAYRARQNEVETTE